MLCLGTPKIIFQYESPESHNRLTDLVKKYLPTEEENNNEEKEEKESDEQNHNAFQVMIIA